MIVVIGRVTTESGKRDELIRVAQTVAAASRVEAGCINYRIYEDTEIENEFVFVEEWESQEALNSHSQSAHTAEFVQAMRAPSQHLRMSSSTRSPVRSTSPTSPPPDKPKPVQGLSSRRREQRSPRADA